MSIIPSDALKAFEFNGSDVRALLSAGEPWWVAQDVATVLDLRNMHSSLAHLDDDEKGVHSVETLGGPQQMATVNEPGLYSLILRSRKPQAKDFKRWITHEVLPALRKHGRYEVAAPQQDPASLELAMRVIALQDRVMALTASNSSLAGRVEEMSAKAEGYDDLIAADGYLDMSAVAKILAPVTGSIGRTRLLNQLRGMGIILQGSTLPEQKLIERGYFQVRTDIVNGKAVASTVATPKGLRWLQAELREDRPTLARAPQPNVVQLPQQQSRGELA